MVVNISVFRAFGAAMARSSPVPLCLSAAPRGGVGPFFARGLCRSSLPFLRPVLFASAHAVLAPPQAARSVSFCCSVPLAPPAGSFLCPALLSAALRPIPVLWFFCCPRALLVLRPLGPLSASAPVLAPPQAALPLVLSRFSGPSRPAALRAAYGLSFRHGSFFSSVRLSAALRQPGPFFRPLLFSAVWRLFPSFRSSLSFVLSFAPCIGRGPFLCMFLIFYFHLLF